MKVLVACEESQAVCKEFRKLGHEAFSCDTQECSGGHPEWHIKGDVLPLLNGDCWFTTENGDRRKIVGKWDMVIAFPPCTHLAVSGAAWFEQKRKDGRQQEGVDFFMKFTGCDCNKVVIENPVGIMSTVYQKPSQIIQPYMFGDSFSKKTCLWIKGLRNLEPTDIVSPGERVIFASGKSMPKWYSDAYKLSPHERAKARSKTFPGIAKAMAQQWGNIIKED